MSTTRARKLGPDRAGLRKISARAGAKLAARWGEFPRSPARSGDLALDPVYVARVVELAQAGDRGARLVLRRMAVRLLSRTPANALPAPLAAYLARVLNSANPSEGLGLFRAPGRDRLTETRRHEAHGWIVHFLTTESGDAERAYREAAPLLGYRSVKSLKRACNAAVLEEIRGRIAAAGEGGELRALRAVQLACRYLAERI